MSKRWLFIALGLLVLAALACAAPGGGSTALYREGFGNSNSGWCVDSDDTSATNYSGGKFRIDVFSTEWFVWCNPDKSFENIRIEVTAENVNKTTDTVFGVMCHYQFLDEFYYVGITSDGDYTIRLYVDNADDILAEGTSSSIPVNAASYKIGMECGNGRIALYVDGTLIDEAQDSTFTKGDIGLYAWSGDETPARIHYDDLEVTALASGGN
jgi:hypothetical protein